jgi:purine catabolism regulator
MLSVEELVAECGLELTSGSERASQPIRWVHISELEDVTPWLSGGELLLTTGIQLSTPARQRRFVARLSGHGLAGLGFGTGFTHKGVPKAIRDECEVQGMPLFEVPYEMPFIAITERAFARLVNEEYDVLQRDARVHEQLERLVLEGRGIAEILAAIAGAAGDAAVLQDATGSELGLSGSIKPSVLRALGEEVAARGASASVGPFEPRSPSLADRALSVPVPGRRGGSPVGWLTVIGGDAPLEDFDRLVARHAAMVVGLELMRERAVLETERRLAGNVLAEALSGSLGTEELRGRLGPFGIGETLALLLFELDDPHTGEAALESSLAGLGVPALVAGTVIGERTLLCAIIDPGERDPFVVAGDARSALANWHGQVRAATSQVLPVGSVRRAFHEARCALVATAASNGEAPDVASHADLGAFTLLLSLQDDDALRVYSERLLEPIDQVDGEYGGELLRSLEAFIEQNGNWERAARQLFCHRHTLRYRMRRIEELTGRDLANATDRIELWLALRARDLVR